MQKACLCKIHAPTLGGAGTTLAGVGWGRLEHIFLVFSFGCLYTIRNDLNQKP